MEVSYHLHQIDIYAVVFLSSVKVSNVRQTRALATFGAIIFIALVVSFLHLNLTEFSSYIPQKAQNYFHHETCLASDEISKLNGILEEFLSRLILPCNDAVSLNSRTCLVNGVNFDRNSMNGNSKKWADISSSQIFAWREGIVRHLCRKQIEALGKTLSSSSSSINGLGDERKVKRGIVMAAGDRSALIRARTSLRLLISYNSTLPVEIFHFDTELSAPNLSSIVSDIVEQWGSGLDSSGTIVTKRVVKAVLKGAG